MIGIVVAMELEKDAIISIMEQPKEELHHDHSFIVGKINNYPVVCTVSGVGKVASSIITSMLIEEFDIQLVINSGVAGGLKEFENTCDTIIASKLAYHDFDNVSVNNVSNCFDNSYYCFETDEKLNKIALESFDDKENKVYLAPIVSGDCFVTEPQVIKNIIDWYPQAYGCDMESTSIVHCCQLFNKKVVIIRSLSDIVVKENNSVQFDLFSKKAASKAAIFTKNFINNLIIFQFLQ